MHYIKTIFTLAFCLSMLGGCQSTTTVTENENTKIASTDEQDLAYEYYKQNISRHNPRAAQINVEMALAYLKAGNVERAQSKLNLATLQDENSSLVSGAMAYFLEMTGEPKKAEQYYQKAIRQADNASKGDANNNYGAFLCKQKRYTQAIEYFLVAVQDPDYIYPGKAYENAGLCALKIPDKTLAEKYFTKALQKQPRSTTSLLEMANISYDNKQYVMADNYLKRYNTLTQPTSQSQWLSEQIANKLESH